MINLANIPQELTTWQLPQWVLWRWADRNGKRTKPPLSPHHLCAASVTKGSDWGRWHDVTTHIRSRGDQYGLGFVLTNRDPFTVIDLDHCVTADGLVEPWAQEIVHALNSYTEITPSGTGLHIWIVAETPEPGRKAGNLEYYSSDRYVTLTGHHLPQTPVSIQRRQPSFDRFVAAHIPPREAPAPDHEEAVPSRNETRGPVNLDPVPGPDLIQRACNARNGARFESAWRGEWEDGWASQSEADLALCGMLAFWTGGDPTQIDSLFRQSGLMRQKWDEQHGETTYGQTTIHRALAGWVVSGSKTAKHAASTTIARAPRPNVATPAPEQSRDTSDLSSHVTDAGEEPDPVPDRNVTTAPNHHPQEPQPRKRGRPPGSTSTAAPAASPAPTSRPKAQRPLTDLGNAERLQDQHGEDLRYCHPRSEWFCWDGTRWAPDQSAEIWRRAESTVRRIHREAEKVDNADQRSAIHKHAQQSEGARSLKNAIQLATTLAGIPVLPEALDADPWIINTLNGVLDLRTGELKAARREYLCTKLAPVEYDPHAQCPTWERFLDQIMAGDDELVSFIQRAAGYTLCGDPREDCLMICHGTGRNGKSTLLQTLHALMGDYAHAASWESFLTSTQGGEGRVRDDLAELAGARYVSASEAAEGRRLDEAAIKQLTGRDMIRARFLYSRGMQFRPAFTIWLAANHKPVIRGTDLGIWSRIRMIPFGVRIERPDPNLPNRLRAELPGIMAWAVRGCLDWQRNGLQPPDAVLLATDDYRKEMDVLSAFLDECCWVNREARSTVGALYEAYKEWSERTGEWTLSMRQFNAKLEERDFRKRRGTGGAYRWEGVGLLDPNSEDHNTSEASEASELPGGNIPHGISDEKLPVNGSVGSLASLRHTNGPPNGNGAAPLPVSSEEEQSEPAGLNPHPLIPEEEADQDPNPVPACFRH